MCVIKILRNYWPSIIDEMNEAVEQLSNKLGINKLQFSESNNVILNLSISISLYHFVVATVDKVANCECFICKRFNATTLLK